MSIEKIDRNQDIYRLSKRGGGKLSVRQLMRAFNFSSEKTVWRIIEREHAKQPTKRKK